MAKNERIFGLGEKDQIRLDKEYEEKMKTAGIAKKTPAPNDVFPPSPGIHMPSLEHLREKAVAGKRAGQTGGGGLETMTLDEYARNWTSNNPDYQFRNMDQYTPLSYLEGAPNLTPQFVDRLIGIAKSQVPTNKRHLLEDTSGGIRIYPETSESKFIIGIIDLDGRIVRLTFRKTPPFDYIYIQGG